jgi:acyl carrier protein
MKREMNMEDQLKCWNCDTPLKPHWKMCPKCQHLVTQTRQCSNCGEELEEGWEECPACGAEQQGEAVSPTTIDSEVKGKPAEDELFEKLKKLIAEKLEIDEKKITMEALLKEDICANEKDHRVDDPNWYIMLYALEEEMGISLSDEEAEKFKTVRDVYEYIKSRDANENAKSNLTTVDKNINEKTELVKETSRHNTEEETGITIPDENADKSETDRDVYIDVPFAKIMGENPIEKIIVNNLYRNASDFLFHENIPDKKKIGAESSYVFLSDDERIVCLFDSTVFGGAKEGICLTTEAIYWKEIADNPCFVRYTDLKKIEVTKKALCVNGMKVETCPMNKEIGKTLDEIMEYIKTQ